MTHELREVRFLREPLIVLGESASTSSLKKRSDAKETKSYAGPRSALSLGIVEMTKEHR